MLAWFFALNPFYRNALIVAAAALALGLALIGAYYGGKTIGIMHERASNAKVQALALQKALDSQKADLDKKTAEAVAAAVARAEANKKVETKVKEVIRYVQGNPVVCKDGSRVRIPRSTVERVLDIGSGSR